eukprot:scaffold131324_cov21-Tisochrysis_lutea.AAC.1
MSPSTAHRNSKAPQLHSSVLPQLCSDQKSASSSVLPQTMVSPSGQEEALERLPLPVCFYLPVICRKGSSDRLQKEAAATTQMPCSTQSFVLLNSFRSKCMLCVKLAAVFARTSSIHHCMSQITHCAEVAAALARMPSVRHISLTACRHITDAMWDSCRPYLVFCTNCPNIVSCQTPQHAPEVTLACHASVVKDSMRGTAPFNVSSLPPPQMHLAPMSQACFATVAVPPLPHTADIVLEVARLRRPIRLCVSNCRLVTPQRWGAAVMTARQVPGCWLSDVKYPEGLSGSE